MTKKKHCGNLNIPPQTWLREYFKWENCDECHKGAKHHDAIPFLGNWFARCRSDTKVSKDPIKTGTTTPSSFLD